MGRFQTVALVEHHLGANSINLDKLWKQSGFRGTAATAKQSEKSAKGTSGDTSIATRMALGAWSREKLDVSGCSGSDWSAQLARLRGSTVLLVVVYMTNGLAESGENLVNMWELVNLIRNSELPFICMGDWNITPEEMEKTEMMASIGAVKKTRSVVEFTCSLGNRLLDCALADRRLESVVMVEPCWAAAWKSHVALEISILRARRTHTIKIASIPAVFPARKTRGNSDLEWKIWLCRRRRGRKPNEKQGTNTASPCGFKWMQSCVEQARQLAPCTTDGQQLLRISSLEIAHLATPSGALGEARCLEQEQCQS